MQTFTEAQDRLFAVSNTWIPSGNAHRPSRSLLLYLCRQIEDGTLQITDGEGTHTFGNGLSPEVEMIVKSPAAWQAVLLEGSAGLGRAYINEWWDSDNPTQVVELLNTVLSKFSTKRNLLAKVRKPLHDLFIGQFDFRPRDRDKDNIGAHYDLGNEFFELFLDETMTYSSGIFHETDESMNQASLNKYDQILKTLQIEATDEILEIGTGWGGFATRAASTTAAEVTTTTISDEQHSYATKKIDDAGLSDRVSVRSSDWRDLTGKYDHVVSIEMIEAVHWRDYESFFKRISDSLNPNGKAAIQAICVPHQDYERIKQTKDFIRTFVFPGGFLPSLEVIKANASAAGLEVSSAIDITPHYSETLRRWRDRFWQNQSKVDALGLDNRFQRLWNFYLCYCEAAFNSRSCTVNQIYFNKTS